MTTVPLPHEYQSLTEKPEYSAELELYYRCDTLSGDTDPGKTQFFVFGFIKNDNPPPTGRTPFADGLLIQTSLVHSILKFEDQYYLKTANTCYWITGHADIAFKQS